MIAPWVLITFAAALAQSLRFMFQKKLKTAGLSTAGATFARFFFAAPFVVAGASLYATQSGQGMPDLPAVFWIHVLIGGTSQILATMCVVALFSHRNFAVGITFKKDRGFAKRPDRLSDPRGSGHRARPDCDVHRIGRRFAAG